MLKLGGLAKAAKNEPAGGANRFPRKFTRHTMQWKSQLLTARWNGAHARCVALSEWTPTMTTILNHSPCAGSAGGTIWNIIAVHNKPGPQLLRGLHRKPFRDQILP
jgi:hypothetical protein